MGDRLDLERLQALLRTDYIGRRVAYEQSVTTTMDIARREAESGAPEGAIAIAEEQTAGRGRLGRSWVSPGGVNLYFTLVLRPDIDQLRYISVVAPLAACEAIEETTNLLPRIKWPNDVAINDRKVCGVMTQSQISDGSVLYAITGIGVNVNMDVASHDEIRDIATSLRDELGRDASREEVLAATLNRFESIYQALRRGEVVSMAWKHRLDTLGKHVRVSGPNGPIDEGVAVDADSDGSLILRRDDGSHVRIEAGEVTLRED
jgi:BirA family transcriptional regulator, biotin operon repressor / biotin---[acetyl-CoA-carboxylase] ligase